VACTAWKTQEVDDLAFDVKFQKTNGGSESPIAAEMSGLQ